jgi:hypothetical protein
MGMWTFLISAAVFIAGLFGYLLKKPRKNY